MHFTPTSDPARLVRLGKREFIDQATDLEHLGYRPGSNMEITGHTAHGDRVATETSTDIILRDGSHLRNRLHQFFRFDPQGKVSEYRTYMDSAVITDVEIDAAERYARAFLAALSARSAQKLSMCTTQNFQFRGADGSTALDAPRLLDLLQRIDARGRDFDLEITGMVAEPDIASVEFRSPAGSSHLLVLRLAQGRVVQADEFASGVTLVELSTKRESRA
jgi:hypothetical protein